VELADFKPSFADGMGGRSVLPGMYQRARSLLAGTAVVTNDQIARAVALLMERARIVAEGAGAAPLAAAIAGHGGAGTVVCIVSGGNIDGARLQTILAGGTP
jgi:threonine dehydratase